MSYLEDIKKLQEVTTTDNRPLKTYASIRCNEFRQVCRVCPAKSSCIALRQLQIPLSIIEEVLKFHPELLV